MIETITAANGWLNGYVWGWPMIVLLLGTGVLLTVLTGGVQFRYLGFALREVLGKITQKSAAAGEVVAVPGRGHGAGLDGGRRQHRRRGDGHLHRRARARCSGCGSRACSACAPSSPRSSSPCTTASPTRSGTMRGGAMYTLRKGLGLPWLGAIFAGLVVAGGLRHRQHGAGQLGGRQPAGVLRRRRPASPASCWPCSPPR